MRVAMGDFAEAFHTAGRLIIEREPMLVTVALLSLWVSVGAVALARVSWRTAASSPAEALAEIALAELVDRPARASARVERYCCRSKASLTVAFCSRSRKRR